MNASPPRRLQTILAVGVAGVLCWAGLSFRARRSGDAIWPTVEGATYPKTVQAGDGAVFTLLAQPRRVVLASATVVDFATALVPRDHIVALCAQAFTASALALDPGPWRDVTAHERFTAEVVLASRPDLVLCNDYNDQQTAVALRRAGVPVLVLPGPSTFADCLRSLDLIGSVLGVEGEAAKLRSELARREQALRQATAAGVRRRGLCFTHNPTGSWTGGAHTLHHEALTLAGLDNAAALAGITGHSPISVERILALDPDVLVVDAPVGGGRGSLAFLRENKTLAKLRALTAGHVVELHPALYAAGSHHVLAAAEAIVAGAPPPAESKR